MLDRDGKEALLLDGTTSNYCCWNWDGEKTLLLLDRDGKEPLLLDGTARRHCCCWTRDDV